MSSLPPHIAYMVNPWPTLPCPSAVPAACWGEWHVWSPEGTESGLQWHVNPGTVSDPQGERRKHKPRQQGREGGREAGAEVTGGRGGESSAQIHSLSPGLANDSGVCLIPGFVTVVLRCPGPSERCRGSSCGLRTCCLWGGTPARHCLCQQPRHSWPVRVLPSCPQRS